MNLLVSGVCRTSAGPKDMEPNRVHLPGSPGSSRYRVGMGCCVAVTEADPLPVRLDFGPCVIVRR